MVNINIQKKDLWLLSAIMVFLVGVGFVISYNPSGTGGAPSIMGHSADEIEGGTGFGAWTNQDSDSNSLVIGVTYSATSDGFVMAYLTPAASRIIYAYTDSNNPPTTIRAVVASAHAADGNPKGALTMPVKKGDYWRITGSSPDAMYWIPLGNGESVRQ